MATVDSTILPLKHGDHLTREEFLRRWDAMPELKRAELIGGIVYMPSPLSRHHATTDGRIGTWIGVYAASTTGCENGHAGTWLMDEDAPHPDNFLRLLSEYGGQSKLQGIYLSGAPEMAAEICWASSACDLHQKYNLYERAGVKEYLAILLHEQEIRWHRLVDGKFEIMPPDADGIHRSKVFPGLWLDGAALLAGNMQRVLAVLADGMRSAEYKEFADTLSRLAK